MRKTIAPVFLVLFLLSACQSPAKPKITLPSGKDPFQTTPAPSNTLPRDVSFAMAIPEEFLEVRRDLYSGRPITLVYEILSRRSPLVESGFLLFVEGRPVPYRISVDGVMREEAYMHRVQSYAGVPKRISFFFEPIGHKKGEKVSYWLGRIGAPWFVPPEYALRYIPALMIYAASIFYPLTLEADAPAGLLKTALESSRVYDIPAEFYQEVYEKYRDPDGNCALDKSMCVELYDSAGEETTTPRLSASGRTNLTLKLLGGPTTKYRVTFLLDNQLMPAAGRD